MANWSRIISRSIWKINEISVDDLSVLERELKTSIMQLTAGPKDISLMLNMVSQKINLVKALVHAERLLEPNQACKEVINV